MEKTNKGTITPEKARKMLEKQGIEINARDAEELTQFLYELAKIFCSQHKEL